MTLRYRPLVSNNPLQFMDPSGLESAKRDRKTKEKLEELVEEERDEYLKNDTVSILSSFVLDTYQDGYEAIVGKDLITEEVLTDKGRLVTLVCIALPVSGKAVKTAGEIFKKTIAKSNEVAGVVADISKAATNASGSQPYSNLEDISEVASGKTLRQPRRKPLWIVNN